MNHLILIVEDEYGNAEVLQLLLEAEGFRVACASNGREALDLLAGERPAVILSDFMMPRMTGAELGVAIRDTPKLADVPFVLLSATSESVIRERFVDYDALVQKPYEIDGLLELVKHLAEHGRPRHATSGEHGDAVAQANAETAFRKILLKVMMRPA